MCLSLFSFTISIPRARQFVESGKMPWMKTFFAAHDVSVRLRTCCLVASSVVAARSLFSFSLSLSREDEGTVSCLYCSSLFHCAQGIIVLVSSSFFFFVSFFFRFCSQKNHLLLLLLLLLRLILGPMKMDCLVLLSGLQTENSGGNRAFLLRRHRHSTKMRFFCCLFPDELLAGDRSLS